MILGGRGLLGVADQVGPGPGWRPTTTAAIGSCGNIGCDDTSVFRFSSKSLWGEEVSKVGFGLLLFQVTADQALGKGDAPVTRLGVGVGDRAVERTPRCRG